MERAVQSITNALQSSGAIQENCATGLQRSKNPLAHLGGHDARAFELAATDCSYERYASLRPSVFAIYPFRSNVHSAALFADVLATVSVIVSPSNFGIRAFGVIPEEIAIDSGCEKWYLYVSGFVHEPMRDPHM